MRGRAVLDTTRRIEVVWSVTRDGEVCWTVRAVDDLHDLRGARLIGAGLLAVSAVLCALVALRAVVGGIA
ncbi:MAG: hypothetical protein ACRDWT_17475 [Jatrophihabitantaceae bacterium]